MVDLLEGKVLPVVSIRNTVVTEYQ